MNSDQPLSTGNWGPDMHWELFLSDTPPPPELCTAVLCVAQAADGRIVLCRVKRGWGLLGGHIEDNETLAEALERELLEEGGYVADHTKQFAYRKITTKAPLPHPQPGKWYPSPHGYIVYYTATTSQPLRPHHGEEVLESRSFVYEDIAKLQSTDQQIIDLGWQRLQQNIAS